jgi:hypothetical protein
VSCLSGTMRGMSDLPTFEDMRSAAFTLLGDAEDWLRSDWRNGTGPTREQAAAATDAKVAIAQAKAALDRAAR